MTLIGSRVLRLRRPLTTQERTDDAKDQGKTRRHQS